MGAGIILAAGAIVWSIVRTQAVHDAAVAEERAMRDIPAPVPTASASTPAHH